MPLSPCPKCGGALRRARRTFVERLFYSEAYFCGECKTRVRMRKSPLPSLRHVHYVKCPRCHSVDLTLLRRRDGIDRMHGSVFNFLHRLTGGKLYHCWFCRLQFYDFRQQFNGGKFQKLLGPPDEPDSRAQLAS